MLYLCVIREAIKDENDVVVFEGADNLFVRDGLWRDVNDYRSQRVSSRFAVSSHLRDGHLVRDVGENGGLHEEALGCRWTAADTPANKQGVG